MTLAEVQAAVEDAGRCIDKRKLPSGAVQLVCRRSHEGARVHSCPPDGAFHFYTTIETTQEIAKEI